MTRNAYMMASASIIFIESLETAKSERNAEINIIAEVHILENQSGEIR